MRQAQADLAHVSRVTTMGELTASLAHEVRQPITAAVTNASSCVRWLGHEPANIDEARAAALRMVDDGRRATEIIGRIRLLFTKGAPQREWVDVNDLIREMNVLLRGEATRGLPQEPEDQIFKAFFTTKEHGLGMGLAISRSIVESHGGRLWAVAHDPSGASFLLTLPTDSSYGRTPAPAAGSPQGGAIRDRLPPPPSPA